MVGLLPGWIRLLDLSRWEYRLWEGNALAITDPLYAGMMALAICIVRGAASGDRPNLSKRKEPTWFWV